MSHEALIIGLFVAAFFIGLGVYFATSSSSKTVTPKTKAVADHPHPMPSQDAVKKPVSDPNTLSIVTMGKNLLENQVLANANGDYLAFSKDPTGKYVTSLSLYTKDHKISHSIFTRDAGEKLTGVSLVMQTDGNVCSYANSWNKGALWCSGTNGKGATHFEVTSDPKLVIYDNNKKALASYP